MAWTILRFFMALVVAVPVLGGAARAEDAPAKAVVAIPLESEPASISYGQVATDALYAMLYALPQVAWQDTSWLSDQVDSRLSPQSFDPRSPEGRERLARFGIHYAVTGHAAVGPQGALTLSLWRGGAEDSPIWQASHPLTGAADLAPALATLLPRLAQAMDAPPPPVVQSFLARRYFTTEGGIAAHGGGWKAYFIKRDGKAAQDFFTGAAASDPYVADAENYLGWSLATADKWDEALPHFRRAAELQPGYFDALWGLQQALDRTGDFVEAAAVRESIDPVYGQHFDVLKARLLTALADRDTKAAQNILDTMDARAGQSAFLRLDILDHRTDAARKLAPDTIPTLLEQRVAVFEVLCGACDRMAEARMDLISALRAAENFKDAVKLERQQAEDAKALGPGTQAGILVQLAKWASADNRDDEAAALLNRLVTLWTATKGEDALETALTRNKLAAFLADTKSGGLDEASRAVAVLARHPAEKMEYGDALITLGRILHRDGKHVEAAEQFRQAVTVLEDADGQDGRETIRARHWQADALWQAGEQDAAIAAYRAALKSSEATNGPDSTTTASILLGLGASLSDMDVDDEAFALLQRAAAIRQNKLGDGDRRTGWALNRLAWAAREVDQNQIAYDAGVKSGDIYFALEGEQSLTGARSISIAAYCARDMGKPDLAEPLLLRATPILEAVEPKQDSWAPYNWRELGRIHMAAGKLDEAEKNFRKGLEIYEARSIVNGSYADTWSDLGDVLERASNWPQAVAAHHRAVEAYAQVKGVDSLSVAWEIRRLARAQEGDGKIAEAIASYDRALDMVRRVAPDDLVQIAHIQNDLGGTHWRAGNNGTAEEFFIAAIDSYEKAAGPRHHWLEWPLYKLASLVEKRGDGARAETLYRRAFLLGLVNRRPNTVWANGRDMAWIWYNQGKHDTAIMMLKLAANALQDYRRQEGGVDLQSRSLVLDYLISSLKGENRRDEAHEVEVLLADGDPKTILTYTPAEEAWVSRIQATAKRLSELSAQAGEKQGAALDLGWRALERSVEELYGTVLPARNG